MTTYKKVDMNDFIKTDDGKLTQFITKVYKQLFIDELPTFR